MKLVLSTFSGAGLLDRGFEQAGFCVVSAGDILWGRHDTRGVRVCACDCGRPVQPGQTRATAACRKRLQRKRDAAAVIVTGPGTDTPAMTFF